MPNPWLFVVLAATALPLARSQAESSRPRRGIAETPLSALLPAALRGDRAELSRIAARIGPARIGTALSHMDPAIRLAALDSLPLLPSALLLLDKLPPLLVSQDKIIRDRSLRITAQLLTSASPEALAEWEVTREFTIDLCKTLLSIAQNSSVPTEGRVEALKSLSTESVLCPKPDLENLFNANDSELRRAAFMLLHPPLARLQAATMDLDASVAAAAGARLCHDGKPLPEPKDHWRRMALAKQTSADDLLDIIPCLAAARDPEDKAALVALRKHPNPIVREAATVNLNPPSQGK